jgi:hypothetical protein
LFQIQRIVAPLCRGGRAQGIGAHPVGDDGAKLNWFLHPVLRLYRIENWSKREQKGDETVVAVGLCTR